MAKQERKSTQLDRLLNAMIESGNRRGYAGASVSTVIGQAGVSRPTFYEYFADRDDCFRAAIEHAQGGLLEAVTSALADSAPEDSMSAAVRTIVTYAEERTDRARFLMSESMAGGAGALDARDRGVRAVAKAIETVLRGAPADAPIVDLDPVIAVGSVYRLLGALLRRGQRPTSRLAEDLAGWVDAYRRPPEQCRWRTAKPGRTAGRSPHVPKAPIQQMPATFGPGRTRASAEEVVANHRLRILYATARLAEQKGIGASTVADITRTARVDGRVFYRLFADKQEAFAATHELGFQQVIDVTSKAFFAGRSWPERSWEGARALTGLLQGNPLVARVGFVEAYSVRAAVQRVEDSHIAFMFFLQEGLVRESSAPAPSRVAMEAIIDAVFEIIYLQARTSKPRIDGMLPTIAHVWLAPFLGVGDADAFIQAQLRAGGPGQRMS